MKNRVITLPMKLAHDAVVRRNMPIAHVAADHHVSKSTIRLWLDAVDEHNRKKNEREIKNA